MGTSDVAAVRRQVARILGLDADGDAWAAVGRADPVVGRLQREFAGFFTAAKPSPYDAAVWGVLSTRMPMTAAAALKIRIAREKGDTLALGGVRYPVFPSPEAVLRIDRIAGLPGVKLARMKGVAEAALDGRLDAERLRAMPEREALADLQRLQGVGRWTASHILYRGAALRDGLPVTEPRVLRGLELACGTGPVSFATLERMAEPWRPFRTWVCVLLARHLARAGGWNAPGLRDERALAGRAVAARGPAS